MSAASILARSGWLQIVQTRPMWLGIRAVYPRLLIRGEAGAVRKELLSRRAWQCPAAPACLHDRARRATFAAGASAAHLGPSPGSPFCNTPANCCGDAISGIPATAGGSQHSPPERLASPARWLLHQDSGSGAAGFRDATRGADGVRPTARHRGNEALWASSRPAVARRKGPLCARRSRRCGKFFRSRTGRSIPEIPRALSAHLT
jgi:hypothetical protein